MPWLPTLDRRLLRTGPGVHHPSDVPAASIVGSLAAGGGRGCR
ncbi:MAG TPA: hypothetical protein VGH67_16100 [Solirubrobacteraceae bacterium]